MRPGWCREEWCYVDIDTCKSSTHQIQRSDYFPNVPNLFFSYSTCTRRGGDAYSTSSAQSALVTRRKVLVAIPALSVPQHYKLRDYTLEAEARHSKENIIDIETLDGNSTRHGPSYRQPHDESPFEGAIIRYSERYL